MTKYVITFILLYVVGAFITKETEPELWSDQARHIFAIFLMITWGGFSLNDYFLKIWEKD